MVNFSSNYPDFSLPMYEQLCKAILQQHFEVKTTHQFLTEKQIDIPTCILRHDVDRQPETALAMAKLEHQLGIRASYYFRFVKGVFSPKIIKAIYDLEHEIGYHYETLSKCQGDHDKAIILFQKEMEELRTLCPITTISMHGRPLSPYDNRTLWEKRNFKDFGIIGECYLSIDYQKVVYFSDTGRTWDPNRYNIRDKVEQNQLPTLESTNDLISFLSNSQPQNICILTHPNRWTTSKKEWFFSATSDFIINQVKRILLLIRAYS